MAITFTPIGTIHTPFTNLDGMPIQPTGAKDVKGEIILEPQYEEGLRDLDGFSHIILLYHFHLSNGYRLTVKPFLDTVNRGLFSTRAPRRPNPIGLSIVRLVQIDGPTLHVQDVDVLDGTPTPQAASPTPAELATLAGLPPDTDTMTSMLTAVLGWVVAVLVFFTVQAGLNSLFTANIGGGQDVCRLLPSHFTVALLLTLIAAALAAALGGYRVAQLEPSLALREG